MYNDVRFEKLHEQFEPMIYHIMNKLMIYKNEKEFYQIGCIALWEASTRFNKDKGEFKSYAYAYMLGRMKTALSDERKKQERDDQLEHILSHEEANQYEMSTILADDFIDRVSSLLTENQSKWVKGYCLYGKTPTEIAQDEGVSIAAVKAWRRDAVTKLKRHFLMEVL